MFLQAGRWSCCAWGQMQGSEALHCCKDGEKRNKRRSSNDLLIHQQGQGRGLGLGQKRHSLLGVRVHTRHAPGTRPGRPDHSYEGLHVCFGEQTGGQKLELQNAWWMVDYGN